MKRALPPDPSRGRQRIRQVSRRKDEAENIMIVDLVRNDLSRCAQTGSVRVTELLDIQKHPRFGATRVDHYRRLVPWE